MWKALIGSAALVACAAPSESPSYTAKLGGDSPLVGVFNRVAADTGVPADLLAAVSYTQTRWSFATPTLVKVLPNPIRRLIGDLSTGDRVLLGLDLRPKHHS
jgi:hypothetical protein